MKKRILLLVTLFIFLVSFLTLILIFNYLDPYRNELVSIMTLGITFTLLSTSFFTIALYVFKKIYYRGEVFLNHIFSSLRQGFLITGFFIGLIIFNVLGVFYFSTIALLVVILFFVEMLFQNFS